MFHMMNEARIAVGLGATMLGFAGYEAALDYAKTRPQGRPIGPGGKDASKPQVRIIEHADVKRMLLAQKSYCEGALALELYCAKLVDELHTGGDDAQARAQVLLEVLTPIAKSWPSEWCLEANSLAIQVLGGYGYTRDFPVEQYWRDNRLNMIHEGTHGIQALDLLGRKVVMDDGAGLAVCARRSTRRSTRARRSTRWRAMPRRSARAVDDLAAATRAAWSTGVPTRRWPTRRLTCRPSATSCWPGSGSTSRSAPRRAGRAPKRGRLAAAATSCYELPKMAPGWRVAEPRRHLPHPRRGVVLKLSAARVDGLIWLLIYGGLLGSRSAWRCARGAASAGASSSPAARRRGRRRPGLGRSRMTEPPPR